jgi:hypothetical protein
MTTVTIYAVSDGRLLRAYSGPEPHNQLRAGEALVEAELPLRGCRIDTATGQPVYFDPVAPSPNLEWDPALQRFKQTAASRQREDALAQIAALEAQQARAIREHAIGRGGTPAELKQRLEDIDDAITTLRATLNP